MSLPENPTASAFVAAPPRLPDIAPHVEVGPSETTIINPIADVVAPAGSRAVVYLRVSSKGQVNTDYDPEGISIPAQRQSCQRKAEQLGLTIVAEYVEAGISGTEMTKRVAFQQMLARIRRDKDVDYVIVYKLSRFARNRTDDAFVMADLQKRGVTLISATESIDSTPVGQLMHGILAAFNEYRSREDGADSVYKMAQKAKNGGTLGKAPIGYINTLERVEGREFRGIAVDKERAPFVKLTFELYDKGEFSMEDVADILTDRGLETRATARRPAGPVSSSKISAMLRDPYYVGDADRIIDSVGRYLGGMVVLALLNATFSTIVMLIVGIPGAPLLGIVVFFITIIPLVGTVLTTIAITLLTLATVPSATIPVLIAMLIYMQVEAYVLTPKVMSGAVQVPGSVVLISATAGGSLLGLPGALIGVPVAASIALILREIVVPARQRR